MSVVFGAIPYPILEVLTICHLYLSDRSSPGAPFRRKLYLCWSAVSGHNYCYIGQLSQDTDNDDTQIQTTDIALDEAGSECGQAGYSIAY